MPFINHVLYTCKNLPRSALPPNTPGEPLFYSLLIGALLRFFQNNARFRKSNSVGFQTIPIRHYDRPVHTD
jgi:hypothetical protein